MSDTVEIDMGRVRLFGAVMAVFVIYWAMLTMGDVRRDVSAIRQEIAPRQDWADLSVDAVDEGE